MILVEKVDSISGWPMNESESYWVLARALIDKDRQMIEKGGMKKG